MMQELDLILTPEIKDRLKNDLHLLASFHLGRQETLTGGKNIIDIVGRNENREQAWLEYRYGVELKDLFFIPERGQNWIEEWVNFSVPEETENQFAFYLGAGYINIEEYELLNIAMEVSRLVHGNELRRDGLRRSLNGHILPGMRLIFEMREGIINDYVLDESGEGINFFNTLFTFLGHDWLEDSQDDLVINRISHFPPLLQEKIRNLTHQKKAGQSKKEYADQVDSSQRDEKFVKMIDRMVNILDDVGKAPNLRIKGENGFTRTEAYITETRENFENIFRQANLPHFEKFIEVVEYVERDSKNSQVFLTFLEEEVKRWYEENHKRKISKGVDVSRDRNPQQVMDHIARMINDLEENSSKYGILFSTGIVGAIYLHDIVNNKSFIDRMRSNLRKMDYGTTDEQQIAKLLRYSLGIAYSSRSIEEKSNIDIEYVDNAYSNQTSKTRKSLKNLFRKPPKQTTIHTPNRREEATEEFNINKLQYYRIRPEPEKIKFNSLRKSVDFDIEGALLRALEVMDNIKHPAPSDPTYAWRNCQESMYFLIPLLESFGLKNAARALTNEVEVHIYKELYGEESIKNVLEQIEQSNRIEEINTLERIINRRVGSKAVIEFDKKGIGSTIKKFFEEGRTVVTDLRRCRINLPSRWRDIDLLADGLEIIEQVIEDYINEGGSITIERPSESASGKKPKLPLRISLDTDEVSEYMVEETVRSIKDRLGLVSDIQYEFLNRPTGYKDLKVVFKLIDREGKSVFYEMIITDEIRHYNNTFGSGARIFKSMVKDEEVEGSEKFRVFRNNEQQLTPDEIQNILDGMFMRSATYIIRSNHGLNLSSKSLEWLKSRQLWGPGLGSEIVDKFDGILTQNSNYLLP